MFSSLRTRFALVVTASGVIIALALSTGLYLGFRDSEARLSEAAFDVLGKELRRKTRQRAEDLVMLLSEALVAPLKERDMAALSKLLEAVKAQPDVDQVKVFDAKGLLLLDGGEADADYGMPVIDAEALVILSSSTAPQMEIANGMIRTRHAVRIGDVVIGGISLSLSLDQARRNLSETKSRIEILARDTLWETVSRVVVVGVLSLLATLALAVFVTGRLTRPLQVLADNMHAVGRGDFQQRIDSRRRDEIGHLEQAFNHMLEDLGDTQVSRRFVELVIGSMNDCLLVVDDQGRVEIANGPARDLFAVVDSHLLGAGFTTLFPATAQTDVTRAMTALAESGERQFLETECLALGGGVIPVSLALSPLYDNQADREDLVCVVRDISERRSAEAQIRFLAQYDLLTGLPNRALLQDRLEHALARAERSDCLVGLMSLDLHGFKVVNDSLGHAIGDQLLRQVADRLSAALRKGDTVARMGGDEFTLVAEALRYADDCFRIVDGLLAALNEPFEIDGHELFVNASAGVTLYPLSAVDSNTLLRHADIAMYRAKAQGKNRWLLYEQGMVLDASRRLELEAELRKAIQREDFELYYQPVVAVNSGEVVAVEALLQWRHPTWGIRQREEFSALLEESGLMSAVMNWVLKTACRQLADWRLEGLIDLRLAVSLPGRQLDDADLADVVLEVLEENGLPPDRLELEVAETTLNAASVALAESLGELRRRGVPVIVDQFGAVPGTFGQRRDLPADTVKLGRNLLSDVPANAEHTAVLVALIQMVRAMGKPVILEGVETDEQFELCRREKVELAQGPYFYRPLSALEMRALPVKGRTAVDSV